MQLSKEREAQINRIRQKLDEVHSRNLGNEFGINHHHNKLNPPLSEEVILDFEQTHKIRLPECYRAFLRYLGNGGAGPIYGIYPLEKWHYDIEDFCYDEDGDEPSIPDDYLSLPCPLYPYIPESQTWQEEFGGITKSFQGTLSLGTRGCSDVTLLIVSGKYTGKVVYANVEHESVIPYLSPEPDFLAWYERWLDQLLQGYDMHLFGYGPCGGEDVYFRILDDPNEHPEYRAEAALAFYNLPKLSSTAQERLVSYLKHPLVGVRSGILWSIKKHRLSQHSEACAELLNDPEENIQVQAIRTIMELEPLRWKPTILDRFWKHPHPETQFSTFFSLQQHLTKSEALELLTTERFKDFQDSLVSDGINWQLILRQFLTHTNRRIVVFVLRHLGKLQAHAALEDIEALITHPNLSIAEAAIECMGTLAVASSQTRLMPLLNHNDIFIRYESLRALILIGDDSIIPIVQTALSDHQRLENERQMNVKIFSQAIRNSLPLSPNPKLRALAEQQA